MFLCPFCNKRQMWLCKELKIYLFNNSFQTCCLETNIIDWKKRMRNLCIIKVGIFGEQFFSRSEGLTDLFLQVICLALGDQCLLPFVHGDWDSPETQICVCLFIYSRFLHNFRGEYKLPFGDTLSQHHSRRVEDEGRDGGLIPEVGVIHPIA